MKSISIFLYLFGISICSFAQQTIDKTLTHDGLEREYILYVPANYTGNSAVPLIFNFHGYTSNATQQMWYGDFRSIADTAGFIVVHPEGTRLNGSTHWNVGGWTVGSTVDDVGFTEAMIDSLSANYNIDLSRVYATGMSNGGYMSFLLACQLSDKIAAIASVTGSMTPEIFTACDPQHPTPVLQIHGNIDVVVPYNGDTWTKPIDDVVEYWVNYNNCNSTAITTSIPNTSLIDLSTAEHFAYEGGDNGATTEHFKITGGGHTWPGSAIISAGTNYDIDASAEIWKFFSRYDLDELSTTTSIDPSIENNLELSIYPNPTHDYIHIEFESLQQYDYHLTNQLGQILLSGSIRSPKYVIDLSPFPQGMYLLNMANKTHKVLKMD